MVGIIVRVVPVLLLLAWLGGTWYTGQALEKHLRSMIRDDPSNIVEQEFDPFAEPEVPPLLHDRVWLSLVDYRRVFLASIAHMQLHVRLAPDEEPVNIPLLAKFHHGPLIFPGGFAVGSARVQITLDDDPDRRNTPPRWGRPAMIEEGALVTRGLIAFDGGFSGKSWLQQVELGSYPIKFELEKMSFALSADADLSHVLVQGDMTSLLLTYLDNKLQIDRADMALRANNVFEKNRYDGVMNVSWTDAQLHYRESASYVSSMEYDTEYRLVDDKLDAELSLTADSIKTAEEDEEDREVIFDYGEAVAAVGELPIERVLAVWDHYRLWEPPMAAMSDKKTTPFERRKKTEHLMHQVSSSVSAYSSLKVGLEDEEFLVRANAEFIGEEDNDGMSQLDTIGQLVEHLLVDLTYHVDGPMTELPEAKQVLELAQELGMAEVDNIGVSGNLHIRAGEVRVNGVEKTSEEFLGDRYSAPLWLPEGSSEPSKD
ncbi:MAG: DUF945 family protein [Granulosicoccaceae bacterium]